MREIEPTLPVFGLRTLDELLDQSLTNERIMLRLLCVFADIELLLPPSVCMACSVTSCQSAFVRSASAWRSAPRLSRCGC